jgi:thioredoxin-like negative regulator of GroEL
MTPQLADSPHATSVSTKAPLLLLFVSNTSGPARRVEGYISHILQRRHNHNSFRMAVVDQDERPDLFDRFHVEDVPTMMVVDGGKIGARLDGYAKPVAIEHALEPWLH